MRKEAEHSSVGLVIFIEKTLVPDLLFDTNYSKSTMYLEACCLLGSTFSTAHCL